MLRGHARFCGILGWPLEQTLSPVVHNAAFRRLGLDWIYLAFPVPPEWLGEAVAGMRALGCMGANVTMPHKGAVADHLDDVSGDASSIGAVNTIQRIGDALIGHNTDVDGFRNVLQDDAGVRVEGRSAVVLGAGGAARAVVRALSEMEAKDVVVVARDRARGQSVGAVVGDRTVRAAEWSDAVEHAAAADIVVNATPLGMRGENALDGARWSPGQCVIDLVYWPRVTPLMAGARATGAEAWGGLGMLIHKAAASLRIWTGQDPPFEAMSAAAVRALGGAPGAR